MEEHGSSSQPQDRLLARRVQEGDLAAFRLLVERYQGPFFRMARRALGEAGAEDAAQEAFLRIFRGIQGFDCGRPFAPWAWRTMANVVASHLARKRRRPEHLLADPPVVVQEPEGERAIATRERRERVRAAVGALAEPYRETILLHYFAGLGVAEISAGSGRPVGTVKVHLFRARRLLLGQLAGERGGEGGW